ncbi:hypothetical protein ACAW74_17245 [Fibrella sp. WM1]|uniref:hypothetical protein n=1 Tax=Fibrella musci TaxID=3242485 RepID=UPI003520E0EE
MKLVKQTKLYFKEGTSDKVYEVDLCEVGTGQYVVNFRFGKRGAALKEGSKTTAPVSLPQAEAVFNALEMEKRKKGYLSEVGLATPPPPLPDPVAPDEKPSSPDDAIRRRIRALAAGDNKAKTVWKPSRVIWQVGERRLVDLLPLLVRLIERAGGQKADDVHRYATLWAIARCGAARPADEPVDEAIVRTVDTYATNTAYSDKVRRIAAEALLHLLTGEARVTYLDSIRQRLPPALQTALFNGNAARFALELTDQVLPPNPTGYPLLEDLYALAIDYPVVRKPLLTCLRKIPLQPPYFRHVRHLYKLAELRDDFEVLGLFAYRFEQSRAYFTKPVYWSYDDEKSKDPLLYVGILGERVKVKAELRKPDSRLAYSKDTRAYLQRRARFHLASLGEATDLGYVRLATAILLSYDKATDYTASRVETTYHWNYNTRSYDYQDRVIPAYAQAVLLNQILFGNSTQYELAGSRWQHKEVRVRTEWVNPAETLGLIDSLIDRVAQLLGKKPNTPDVPEPVIAAARDEPYPALWDQLPQAYVQLLVQARVDEIHAFAYRNLTRHPDYSQLEKRVDLPLLRQLLASPFEIPARWGVELVRKRMATQPDPTLIPLLISSPVADVRQLGLEYVGNQPATYLTDPATVIDMILSPHADVRQWLIGQYPALPKSRQHSDVILQNLLDRLLQFTEPSDTGTEIATDASRLIGLLPPEAFQRVSAEQIDQLLDSPIAVNQQLAAQVMERQNTLSAPALLARLLGSPDPTTAQRGQSLWASVATRARDQRTYGTALLAALIPILIRAEVAEGQHQGVADFILAQLQPELRQLERQTVLRLVYASFGPAQQVGAEALRTLPANTLTLRQVIALGNHETLALRRYAWQYFRDNVPQIRYERDEAIRLLDAHWDDTRQEAIAFFRDTFTADDWDAETLVGLADSVRPDIQAFGRELIARYFTDEQGPTYLMRLSQHPSANVQLFTTNYLQQYAANNPERLRGLSFYFRTVLMRANQGRLAKDRILAFLGQEGMRSAENARFVGQLLTEVSATSAIGDKATCLQWLSALQNQFPDTPVPFVRQEV